MITRRHARSGGAKLIPRKPPRKGGELIFITADTACHKSALVLPTTAEGAFS
jgi:hypothetical protein